MAKTWNPLAPSVLGLEWLMTAGNDSTVQATLVRDTVMDSTQAETVTGFQLQIKDVGALGAGQLAPSTIVEVFNDGSQHTNGPITTTIYPPTVDVTPPSVIGLPDWVSQPGNGIVNLWSFIDEPVTYPLVNPTADWLSYQGGVGDPYVFQVGSAAFPLTQRILQLRIKAVVGSYTAVPPNLARTFAIRLRRISDGVAYTPVGGTGIVGDNYTDLVQLNLGEINPWEDRPWIPADVREFRSGGNYAVQIEAVGDSSTYAALFAIQVEVDHMTENRLAVGMWRRPASQASALVSTTSLITLPGGAATWAKATAPARHVYRWRIPNDYFRPNPASGTPQWRTAQQRLTSVNGENGPYSIRADVTQVDVRGLAVGSSPGGGAGAINLIVAGVASSDSQPYWVDPAQPAADFTSAVGVEQQFTPGTTASYLSFRFLVKPPAASPTSLLTFHVRRTADNVQFGGTFTITAAQALTYPLTPDGWRVITGFLSAATGNLIAATEYAMRWSITGAGTWQVPRAKTSTAGNPSFMGTGGSIAGWSEPSGPAFGDASQDVPAVLLQQPPTVISAAAEVMATPTRQGTDCMCQVDAVEHVVVTWVNNSVPGFARLEVERYLDTGDSTVDAWHLVMQRLSSPLAEDAKWTDREVPRGIPARYRIRNVDTNGSYSQWVETDFAMPQARGCELIFTSNEVSNLTVVYQHEPQVSYDPLGFRNDVLMQIEGADYQLAFVESEERGIATTLRVVANFGRQPCDDIGRPIGKRAVFAPLMRAARAPGLPYVCVLDSDGNRTFAHLLLDGMVSEEPGWRYYTDATVTPITGEPQAVVIP